MTDIGKIRYYKNIESEDIIRSSLSEIAFFLLFFFSLLLGEERDINEQLSAQAEQLQNLQEDYNLCVTSLSESREAYTNCVEESDKWPPVFRLSEAEGYSFPSGEATLSDEFRQTLNEKHIPVIIQAIENEKYAITSIEVIGHTDEQPVGHTESNIDESLSNSLNSDYYVPEIEVVDNAGLGLARAVAVRIALQTNEKLRNYPIFVFSAAHSVNTDGTIDDSNCYINCDVSSRRRIEIRLRGDASEVEAP